MTPIGSAAFSALGSEALPSFRTVFTPAAFASSQNVIDRALRGRQALATAQRLSEAESQFRRTAMDEQVASSAARKLAQEEELFAMQPMVRQELAGIDITDDHAFERLTELESSVMSPADQRRLRSMRAGASAIAREKSTLLDRLQVLQDPQEAEAIYGAAVQAVRDDPMALRRAALGLPTANQASSMIAEESRIRAEARQAQLKSRQEVEDATMTLKKYGRSTSKDIVASLKDSLAPVLASPVFANLDKSLIESNPDKFITDMAMAAASSGEKNMDPVVRRATGLVEDARRALEASAKVESARQQEMRLRGGSADSVRTGDMSPLSIIEQAKQQMAESQPK
jgi:hypothetical protein